MHSDSVQWRLLNEFQRNLPLVPRPFAAIAERLGIEEAQVLEHLQGLAADGAVSRVGPVIRPHVIGSSILAAMAVPPERVPEVAALVSARPEVNHNYERDHRFNLWFVITAKDDERVESVVKSVERCTGLRVVRLPLIEEYFIDLGFPMESS